MVRFHKKNSGGGGGGGGGEREGGGGGNNFKSVCSFLAGVAVTVAAKQLSDAGTVSSEFLMASSVDNTIGTRAATSTTTTSATSASSSTSMTVGTTIIATSTSNSKVGDFFEIGKRTGSDKVQGGVNLPLCLQDKSKCRYPDAVNPQCRVPGHYYHTLYNQWLRPLAESSSSSESTTDEKFTALEIGFYHGKGYEAFSEFLTSHNPNAVVHSMEISCIEQGPREEGKWPWGNFAEKNRHYQELLTKNLLHCGDASDYHVLKKTWTEQIQSSDAPLKLVIDDGAHLAKHMAITLFFWFPRIAPGGLLVVEDIEPLSNANGFRQHVLPQVMSDLHYCGNDEMFKDRPACFPTIQPFLQSIHCEMHICVFQRNSKPATEPSEADSMPPPHALDAKKCLFG